MIIVALVLKVGRTTTVFFTSGLVASYFLRSICERLSLYGLGTVDVPDVPYHYFLGTIGR